MITASPLSSNYLTHFATLLGVANEERVLSSLVRGLRTVQPSPASVLVLDVFNHRGQDDCNIQLVETLMRYIYQHSTGIVLYMLTQSAEVASALHGLNAWQKIGPLEGMTQPTRAEVMGGHSHLPQNVPLLPEHTRWTLERLTLLVQSRYVHVAFDKTEEVVMRWLNLGMTPVAALVKAQKSITAGSFELEGGEGIIE